MSKTILTNWKTNDKWNNCQQRVSRKDIKPLDATLLKGQQVKVLFTKCSFDAEVCEAWRPLEKKKTQSKVHVIMYTWLRSLGIFRCVLKVVVALDNPSNYPIKASRTSYPNVSLFFSESEFRLNATPSLNSKPNYFLKLSYNQIRSLNFGNLIFF